MSLRRAARCREGLAEKPTFACEGGGARRHARDLLCVESGGGVAIVPRHPTNGRRRAAVIISRYEQHAGWPGIGEGEVACVGEPAALGANTCGARRGRPR